MYLEIMSYHSYNPRKKHNTNSSEFVIKMNGQLKIIVAFLVVIGLMSIFSATAPKCMSEGSLIISFMGKQLIYVIVGLVCMGYLIKTDYHKLEKYNKIFMWVVVSLLLVLQFTPLGVSINGAKRWINLGIIQLQPSELAKPLFCMLLASLFKYSAKFEEILTKRNINSYILPMLAILFLIYKQPNLSMTLILFGTAVVIYICAKGSLKPIIALGSIGMIGILSILPKLLHGYQMRRIEVWLNPGSDALGSGYNIIQSLIAFASGGMTGTGYGGSIQKLAYLPECHTDFIFAIIAEEFGFIGCCFIIGLFLALIHQGLSIAKKCPDMYGKLLAIGITFIFGFQAFLNMSVASSLLPVTGVTLPFISYGGTSIIVSLAMIGILLNISKQKVKRIKVQNNE